MEYTIPFSRLFLILSPSLLIIAFGAIMYITSYIRLKFLNKRQNITFDTVDEIAKYEQAVNDGKRYMLIGLSFIPLIVAFFFLSCGLSFLINN